MQNHNVVVGYQIEFDETGQVLRLKNEKINAETNATLSVMAARLHKCISTRICELACMLVSN